MNKKPFIILVFILFAMSVSFIACSSNSDVTSPDENEAFSSERVTGDIIEFRKQDGEVVLTGSDIESVSFSVSFEEDLNQEIYSVVIVFTEVGGEIFSNVTRELSQRVPGENHLEIFVGGELVTNPMVIFPIESGSAMITVHSMREVEMIKGAWLRSL
ncbi:MAG: hypothetical protein FWD00_00655 [Clostridiales bacterium]|nr:hypothetical protein [Clostridiales bacterium]